MATTLNILAALLMAVGLVGAVVPMLPGIPLIFGGIWLIAAVDHYQHLGIGWLLGIAAVGAVGLLMDLVAGTLGAKRVGASPPISAPRRPSRSAIPESVCVPGASSRPRPHRRQRRTGKGPYASLSSVQRCPVTTQRRPIAGSYFSNLT